MRIWIRVLATGAIGAIAAFASPPASAKFVRDCNADYEAKKAELQAAAITATEARTTAVPATVRRRRAGLIEVRGRRVDMVIELLCQGDPG